MSWVAYLGPFNFPWGQPGSRRVYGVARSIAGAGIDVIVGSGESNNIVEQLELPNSCKGKIKHVGLGELPPVGSSNLGKLFKLFITQGINTVKWLDEQESKPSHVIVYGGYTPYVNRVKSWCNRNNIPIIIDVVEWYQSDHMTGGFFGPFHLSAKFALKFVYKNCDGIIAISSYLESYFKGKGCLVTVIPPTLSVVDISHELISKNSSNNLQLIYAGSPGKKDLLNNIIAAVMEVSSKGFDIELTVLGVNKDNGRIFVNSNEIPTYIKFLGRVKQSEVANYIRASDFSVLVREPAVFSNAGFPTKFVESMTHGTPVIANLTSDLSQYIDDGVNGIVCKDQSVDGLVSALENALRLTSKELLSCRKSARETALKGFDCSEYESEIASFLRRVKNETCS